MLADRIAGLDVSLFDHVADAQTKPGDRRALLALHDGVARRGAFTYLEIGSYMGGSLQVAVADPRCEKIVSIDPRPPRPPDIRGGSHEYPDNTTARMLELLSAVPRADLRKIEPIEASSENIDPDRLTRPDLCFVDGEHTDRAVLRDAMFCRQVLRGRGIIAFHDAWLVQRGILSFLRRAGRPRRSYALGFDMFVVELGDVPTLLDHPPVRELLQRPRNAWHLASRLRADQWLWALAIARRRLRYGH